MTEETVVTDEFIDEMRQKLVVEEGTSLFEASEGNICVFAEKMLGFKLYAWQIDFLSQAQKLIEGELVLDDDGKPVKELAALTSRQIGKSFCLAIISIWSCLFNKAPGTAFNTTVVGVISASDRQAKELMREVRKLIIAGDTHMESKYDRKGFFSSFIDGSEQNNTEILTFLPSAKSPSEMFLKGAKSGPQIMSYPPTQKVLGKSFTLLLIDEIGRKEIMTDAFLLEELFPTGSATSARRILTSTPWFPSGYFYEVVHPQGRYYGSSAVVKYTIEALATESHAAAQYDYVMDEVKRMRAAGDHTAVRRGYYCEFVKPETNFFDPDKVRMMYDKDYPMYESYEGLCDIGIDLGGKTTSHTVITVSAYDEDSQEIYRLYSKQYEVDDDDTIISDLEDDIMVRFPNWQRIIYDEAPVATYLIKEMERKGWLLEPMPFRTYKVKKFGVFRSKLNRHEVFSYNDGNNLAEQMNAMEINKGSTQSKITVPKGTNDDLIDSFVISCFFFLEDDTPKFGMIDFSTGEFI